MKLTFLIMLMTFSIIANCQPRLVTTKIKYCNYNTSLQSWGSWSEDWSYQEAKHRFTQIDAFGLFFRVELTINGKTEYAKFIYSGYDVNNNWYKYTETNSTDIIYIRGVKMSYLATKGWPDYDVEIYIFSKKNKLAWLFL